MRQIILAAVAILVTACGASSSTGTTGTTGTTPTTPSTPTTPTATTSVTIASFAFNPASIAVAGGAIVTFTNNDAVNHNVTFDNATIGGSGNFSTGAKTITMPTAAGAYTYKCTLHGGMTGTVTVQ